MEKLLIFVEIKDGRVRKASLELLSVGRSLSDTAKFSVEAVVMGHLEDEAKQKILSYVDKLVHINDPILNAYTAEGYSAALSAYAQQTMPKVVVAGATRIGRDFMPRVAVLLQSGMASDVTAVEWDSDPLTFVRPIFGGKVLTEISFSVFPAVVTTRPNTFNIVPPPERSGEYVEQTLGLSPDQIKVKPLRVEAKASGKVDLRESDIVISGGQGMKSAENFAILEDLAQAVGGAVGATRSAVDSKWREYDDQVGKSGKTISPKLYIAVGISGAIHHIMGMGTSKVVLAVNKDANAPIFKYADYGVVGDLFEFVPVLTEEMKKRLGK
jgi:electron transfer flavoprotein alpha subunit